MSEPDPEPQPKDIAEDIVIGDASLGSPVVAYGDKNIVFFSDQKAFKAGKPLWQREFDCSILPPYPIPIPERLHGVPNAQRAMLVCTPRESYVLSLNDGSVLNQG